MRLEALGKGRSNARREIGLTKVHGWLYELANEGLGAACTCGKAHAEAYAVLVTRVMLSCLV